MINTQPFTGRKTRLKLKINLLKPCSKCGQPSSTKINSETDKKIPLCRYCVKEKMFEKYSKFTNSKN